MFIAMGTHKGQQSAFVIAAPVLLSMVIRSTPIKIFCIYLAFWALVLHGMAMIKMIHPAIPTRAIGEIVFITIGLIVYVVASRGRMKYLFEYKCFYNIVCVSAIVQCLLVAFQQWGFDPVFSAIRLTGVKVISDLGEYSPTGTLFNPNFLSVFLAISIPFFFRKTWNYFIPLLLLCMVITKTSSAMIALATGMIFYFRSWKLAVAIGCLAISYICLDLYFSGDFTAGIKNRFFHPTSRFMMWKYIILNKIIDHPLSVIFGYGPGTGYGTKAFFRCPLHNEWLDITYSYGVAGLTLAIWYFKSVLNVHKILSTAILIAGIAAIFNYSMHLVPSAMLILIIMGLLEKEKHGRLSELRGN
jgi:hypothetical protein